MSVIDPQQYGMFYFAHERAEILRIRKNRAQKESLDYGFIVMLGLLLTALGFMLT